MRTMTEPVRNQLAEKREALGFTQFSLSVKSLIPQSTLSLYENGHRFPQPDAIAAIATALGKKPETVYRWLITPATATPASEAETAELPVLPAAVTR